MATAIATRPRNKTTIAANLVQACKEFADMEAWHKEGIIPGYNEGVIMSIQHDGLQIEFKCTVLYRPSTFSGDWFSEPEPDAMHVLSVQITCIEMIDESEVTYA